MSFCEVMVEKKFGIAAAVCVVLAIGAPAQASPLIGAKTIEISNAASTTGNNLRFIQIAEVIASQLGTGTDVALASNGATATATSSYGGIATPDHAIDGIFPASYPNIYHSGGNDGSDVLTITLASAFDLASLTIYNRGDGFNARDIYNVTIRDASSALLYNGVLDDSAVQGAAVTVNFVPEPATWAMFALGLLGLGWTLRAHKRQADSRISA